MKNVFIIGGTGYIGTRLIKQLIRKGHHVKALVRSGSENKLPERAEAIFGNPFDASSFYSAIPKGAVFVQLLGVSHPSPRKAKLFKEIDLQSLKASVDAASTSAVSR